MKLIVQSALGISALALAAGLTGITGMAQADVIAEGALSYSEQGHFLIEMNVDGVDLTMVVDTGATNTVVMDNGIAAAGLTPDSRGAMQAHGVSGSTNIEFYDVDSMRFGDHVWRSPRLMSVPNANASLTDQGIEGIVGVDILSEFVLEFDQTSGRFRLHESIDSLRPDLDGWQALPLRAYMSGLTVADVEINGAPITAFFDTGASRNLLNPEAAEAAGYSELDPRLFTDEPPVRGLSAAGSDAVRAEDIELHWSNVRFSGQNFTISDAPVFDLLRMGDRPAAAVGIALFGGRDFAVDFENLTVWIAPDSAL
jgi:predicted aspartyl protease